MGPRLAYLADTHSDPFFSLVVVYEDGKALPLPHAHHGEICTLGNGRFVHWGEQILFSTSDNSDPRTNGRTYTYSRAWWHHFRHYGRRPAVRRGDPPRVVPLNFQVLDPRPAAISAQCDYVLGLVESYLSHLPGGPQALAGARVLEAGPGPHFGFALAVACAGARQVVVADPYLAQWDAHFHPLLYEGLRCAIQTRHPDWTTVPLDRVLEDGTHQCGHLDLQPCSVASMTSVADASIDVTLSTAVLEHVADLQAAVAELARVTRPGSLGLHRTDHRDHRDFERPLEYLLLEDDAFERLFADFHGECGNRYRPCELREFLETSGFEVLPMEMARRASKRYLRRIVSRLQANPRLRYHGFPPAELGELSSLFCIRRRR